MSPRLPRQPRRTSSSSSCCCCPAAHLSKAACSVLVSVNPMDSFTLATASFRLPRWGVAVPLVETIPPYHRLLSRDQSRVASCARRYSCSGVKFALDRVLLGQNGMAHRTHHIEPTANTMEVRRTILWSGVYNMPCFWRTFGKNVPLWIMGRHRLKKSLDTLDPGIIHGGNLLIDALNHSCLFATDFP